MSGARLVVLAAVSAVAYLLYLKLKVRFKSIVSLLPPPERDLHSIFLPILILNRCRKMRLRLLRRKHQIIRLRLLLRLRLRRKRKILW